MIHFRAATDIYWDGVRVIAGSIDGEGKIASIAEPVLFNMVKREPHTPIVEPTFCFTSDEAKNLMTALWEAGIRPAGVSSPSAEIKRIEEHLSDMRRLVFKQSDAADSASKESK